MRAEHPSARPASAGRPATSALAQNEADDRGEAVYTSALQLIQERFGQQVTTSERARDVDPDDVGGI